MQEGIGGESDSADALDPLSLVIEHERLAQFANNVGERAGEPHISVVFAKNFQDNAV